MGKKYVMFVDERGFLVNTNNNITMIGLVFEGEYCLDSEDLECELRTKLNGYKEEIFNNRNFKMHLDDIILDEKVYTTIENIKRNRFINELAELFKGLKFSIISSTIKKDVDDSYGIVIKKLLKKFHSFIARKNAESGAIILQARKLNENYVNQQYFFDVYNDVKDNSSIDDSSINKINTFIVCEKSDKNYGLGIEILNIMSNIISRVSNGYAEFDRKLISYMEYGNKNRVFTAIKHKEYQDIDVKFPCVATNVIPYDSLEIFDKELKILTDKLRFRDKRINEKEEEIKKLTNQIQLLNVQLEDALYNKKRDNIISKILSDIDVKMEGFEKITTVAKN